MVWSVKHFKHYKYGVNFAVVSDDKAFKNVLKSKEGNKTFSMRVTRLVDRLLPFDFNIVHTAGRTLGLVDYLSGQPSQFEGTLAKAGELFNNWFLIYVVK